MSDIRDFTGKNRRFTGTDSIKLPAGSTAQRNGSPTAGDIRFNNTTNLAEYYTGTDWKSIDSPPTITFFTIDGGADVTSGAINASAGGNATIEVKGSLFDTTGATVTFVGTSETLSTASITRNSANLLTVTVARDGFDNANEPYAIKVTNGSGLSATLEDALVQNTPPAFGTAADTNLGEATLAGVTLTGGNSAVATDADGDTVTHTISAGSLPTGISLATDGSFTGTVTSGTGTGTSTFTVSATDGTDTVTRQFLMDFTDAYDVQYLVVAGGGGGGGDNGGGGGAGGYRTATGYPISAGTQYTITVGGSGSSGRQSDGTDGGQGGSSVFATITSAGGGGGRTQNQSGSPGLPGGSGGGVGQGSSRTGGAGNTPSVSPSQGNPGGYSSGPGNSRGGGGGGAGATGQNGTSGGGGTGGAGTANTITGSSVTYAGGGGGGADQTGNSGAPGGSGGGANGGGGNTETGTAPSGSANTGGGGGGGAQGNGAIGGQGGTGVVILRMATANYSGTTTGSPTVTTSGTDTILKYNGSGTYTG